MTMIDVPGFAAEAEALALRFEADDLPGLLSKRLDVPAGSVALCRDGDGGERLLRASDSRTGSFRALLVKTHDQPVSFHLKGLRSQEGRELEAGIEVVVRLPGREVEMKALETTLLATSPRLTVDALRAYLLPAVRAALGGFVRARASEELHTLDLRAELGDALRAELKAPAFSAGLDILDVRHPSFYSDEYERVRRARLEAKDREEELQRSERIQELKARLERNERLKRQEVEEFAKVLQYEGMLKEVSLKNEVGRRRHAEELKRFEAVYKQVGNDDLKALIFLLEDDRLKAQLIQQLIERDMSEEQLRARRGQELEHKLEARLGDLAQQLGVMAGKRQRRVAESGMRTRRVLLVLGKQTLAYDPTTNVRRDAPKEVYDFERRGLGYLRGVRAATTSLGPTVLCGAQHGVYVLREGEDGQSARELRYPSTPRGQGGVNAIAYFDAWVYASHSEMGVWRWDLDGIVRPERLYEHVTSRYDSTRGVTTTPDGKLYFASGPDVHRADLLRPEAPLAHFRGTDTSVTTFLVTRDEVFAGTRNGRVLRWSLADPGSPRELSIRKANPIYMLKVAELNGEPHLLVGAKEHGITAFSVEDGRAVDYRAPDQIRWVDGASDFVYGVTRGGYAMHVWSADRLDQVDLTVHTIDRVQDIFVLKEPFGASAV